MDALFDATQPAARSACIDALLGRAAAQMRPGWVLLRDCSLGGRHGEAPARIRYALLHARVGIALLDILPGSTAGDATERLHGLFHDAGFAAAFSWHPPIIHLHMPAHSLASLEEVLEAEFARVPSPVPTGGPAWVDAAQKCVFGEPIDLLPPVPGKRSGPRQDRSQASARHSGFRSLIVFWSLVAVTVGGGAAFLHHLGPPPALHAAGGREHQGVDGDAAMALHAAAVDSPIVPAPPSVFVPAAVEMGPTPGPPVLVPSQPVASTLAMDAMADDRWHALLTELIAQAEEQGAARRHTVATMPPQVVEPLPWGMPAAGAQDTGPDAGPAAPAPEMSSGASEAMNSFASQPGQSNRMLPGPPQPAVASPAEPAGAEEPMRFTPPAAPLVVPRTELMPAEAGLPIASEKAANRLADTRQDVPPSEAPPPVSVPAPSVAADPVRPEATLGVPLGDPDPGPAELPSAVAATSDAPPALDIRLAVSTSQHDRDADLVSPDVPPSAATAPQRAASDEVDSLPRHLIERDKAILDLQRRLQTLERRCPEEARTPDREPPGPSAGQQAQTDRPAPPAPAADADADADADALARPQQDAGGKGLGLSPR